MKKILLSAITAGFAITSIGQMQTADFETPLNFSDTAWFGQDQIIDGDTTFMSGGIEFENNYNASWQSFSGWAYSNSYDQTTPGYSNQFSAITGTGHLNSNQFGLCNANGNSKAFISPVPYNLNGAYFTNSTYAFLSMQDGDSFAKKFGDSTDANGTVDGTNGEDWFLLTIYGLGIDSARTDDSVNFYLADYRFSDNSQDFIVENWEFVDLSSLGLVYGLDFKLSSSDQGNWGMNTPAYFAMDNLSAGNVSLADNKPVVDFKLFPNPVVNYLNIELKNPTEISIIDVKGRVVYSKYSSVLNEKIQLENLNSGLYFIRIETNGFVSTKKIIKT